MLWRRARRGDVSDAPRTVLLAGKAAPSYRAAKLIVRLATGVAEVVAADPAARGRLRVVFVPDFNVKNAQWIYPAADLSEQISTAGMEASGTGNMKLMMNGALTLGTLAGANVEIREAVGAEHFFLFGLTAEEVLERRRAGVGGGAALAGDDELREAVDLVASGVFARGDREVFAPLVHDLVEHDAFAVLADFRAYADAQRQVVEAWSTPARWTRSSILNVARSGRFSSDRAVLEYARQIWRVR